MLSYESVYALRTKPRTFYIIRQLQLATIARLDGALCEFDITPAQYTVLSLSYHSDVAPSSAELSRRVGISAQAMNETIAALGGKDLIERRSMPDHRRILRIFLTPSGLAILKRCDEAVDKVEARFVSALTRAEHIQFRELSKRLLHDADLINLP